jgi:YD repeat-containing protein
MCPSLAVLAGGGDGGGGSGNGAGDGSGNADGSGNGNGDGAGGDGVGAGNSGAGGGGGCPNPQHGNPGSTTAGDPIDPISGRVFTIAALDFVLGGPLRFFIRRRYASARRQRDVGLGHGWTHTFAWEIETRRASVVLYTGDGGRFTLDPIPTGEARKLAGGHVIREIDGYRLVGDDGTARIFRELSPSSGVFKLTRVEDGYQNAIRLHYSGDTVTHFTDAVGRTIRVDRDAGGRIAAFSVHVEPENRWQAFVTYTYDEAGDLVVATDARGLRSTYAYRNHLLVRETTPSGRATHYVYDESARCEETWVEPSAPALDAGCSEQLADGSRAKGVLHVKVTRQRDYVEVVTSRDVKRYFVSGDGAIEKAVFGGGVHENEFDDWGHLTRYVDATGATWQWARDDWGRVASATNPQGAKRTFTYDAGGRVTSETGVTGRVVHYDRNPQGDLLLARDDVGPLIQYDYDARGLTRRIVLPDGATTRLGYDAHGNRDHIVEPSGAERRIQYDFFGRATSFVDERGSQTSFAYDPCGRLVRVKFANGSARHYAYDRDGNLSSVTNELGQQYVLSWGGYKRSTRSVARTRRW